ncbi:MAG: hypothetical protein LBL07_17045 [Tannerella sp.]|jgi:hypothetical protein|nr:hypothetical protein [Tannerella sp.]
MMRTVLIFMLLLPAASFARQEGCLFEKAYLHLDRHFYLSGDDIWFRAYLMNAQTNEPASGSSRILYAELISPDARILDRKILHVDGYGCSTGDFRLKKSAPPGRYRIRAYTGWMLNFGDVFVFEKEIEVQGIPDGPEVADTKKKRKDGRRNVTVTGPEDVDIEFFPESGSLVSGIENTVAFRAADRSGKGVNVSGGVLNSRGDTLALFTGEYLGMGKFAFTPQAGESYYAFFRPDGIPYPFFEELPEPLEKGFTISILDQDTVFRLNIQTNPGTYGEFAGKKMQLAFKRSEMPLFGYTTVLPEGGSQFLDLPKRLLPAGITRIILYDEQERPWCERLVYIESREEISVRMTSVNDTAAVLRLTAGDGRPVRACLSMSVTGQAVPDETFDMESYVWLESEVRGKIERPGAYFDTANADRLKQMDLLLLTQGWRDYVWIHTEKGLPGFSGYRQEQGLAIAGRVKKLWGKKPYPDANIYLFFPHMGLEKGVRYTQTDSLGRYDFGHVDFWGNQGIFINSRSWKQKEAGEIFLYPLCMPEEMFPVKARPHYEADSIYKFPAEHYEKKDWKVTDTIRLDLVTVVGRNPKGWLMSDHEITEKDDKRWQSLLFYLGGEAFCLAFGGCPATYNYFDMDGKRIYNRVPPSKISMKEVDRVIVHRKDKFRGPFYTIDVYAKNGAFSTMNYATIKLVANGSGGGFHVEKIDNPQLSVLKPVVIGYYEARKFYRPEYVETSAGYYGTLFWKPDIRTDANGEAALDYNPGKQVPGKARIEGLTDRGIPFTVKLN